MAIGNLSFLDAVTASTTFAVNLNGRDYQVSAADLLTYVEDNITSSSSFGTQFSAPSATAFSVQVSDGTVWLVLTPVAGYADGTIVLPASPTDGDEFLCNCTQSVAALVVDGGTKTVTGEPSALSANGFFRLRYEGVTGTWYRVG